MASDGDGVFAATGNNTAGAATHLDSEEIVRITGLGTLDRATGSNHFYPTSWYAMDRADADFASNNPMYVPVPGATPSAYVVAFSKDGHMYLLDSANLGGLGGQLVDFLVSTGNSIHTVADRLHLEPARARRAVDRGGAQCPPGSAATGRVVMSVAIPPGAPPAAARGVVRPDRRRRRPARADLDHHRRQERRDRLVHERHRPERRRRRHRRDDLRAAAPAICAGVRQWTSPIAVKGRIVVGADGHLCSWSVAHPPAGVVDAAATPG